jgi:DNA-binding CsgD family transcriptional regulator/PAS domain-containing protein
MPGREDGSLVDLIYDAALEPAQWESVIARMAALVGGTSGWLSQLNFIDGSGGHLHDPMAGVDTSWVPKYLEYFADRNPFATAADPQDYLAKWTPLILTNDDELPREELVRTEFFNDWMRPQDVASSMMIRLAKHGNETAVLNIHCSLKHWQYEQSEIETAAAYHPHLIRAFNLGRKLAWQKRLDDSASSLFDASAHALLIVDRDARIQRANRAAEVLLAGENLISVGGRLSAAASSPTRRLHGLIAAAASAESRNRTGGSMALPTEARLPLSIVVVPFGVERLRPFHLQPLVLVCVTDLSNGVSPPQQRLRELFGLTAAEARLALALFEGATPGEAAARFGISPNTARAQLACVFEKTRTGRQAELVRLTMKTVGVELLQ